jgi:hypothetical protein
MLVFVFFRDFFLHFENSFLFDGAELESTSIYTILIEL